MMRFTVLVIFLLLNAASATFTPVVTLTCALGPTYTATIASGGSTTGVIFIDGQCAAQNTAATGTYTFNSAACSAGTVPALGTSFKLVVQEYATFNTADDYIVQVTCTLDTAAVTKDITLDAAGENYDVTDTSMSVSPTFTTAMKNSGGTAISSGNVGDTVSIVLSIPTAEAAVFDYQVTSMTATVGADVITIVTAGCTQYSSILAQPSAQSAGSLTLSFTLFIPKNTATTPALPGVSATTVTYSFVIEVCDSSCTAPSCNKRRKRSISSSNSTFEPVEVATSLVVYPPGHKRASIMLPEDGPEEVNVCLSRTPLIGVLVALSLTLAVCVGITAWMFCRLRRPSSKDMSAFSNKAYAS